MHSAVTEASIQKASELFWEQMLAMRLEPVASAAGSEQTQRRCIGPAHVLASCELSGIWAGRIEVRLSSGLALSATAAMLMQSLDAVQPTDTLDAVQEIANMIAGTLKSALPRPCSLSVPSASLSSEDFCVLPRTHDTITVFFQHDSGMLMVRVWEYESSVGATEPLTNSQFAALCAA